MANNIKYTSNATKVKSLLTEVERLALKEVAKVLRKAVKNNVPQRTGALKKAVGTFVKSKTGSLQVGVYSKARCEKRGLVFPFYSALVEFGTRSIPAKSYLRNTTMAAIPEIREIIERHLPHLSKKEEEVESLLMNNELEEIADD
jgi:HK97 gp10 family phage protein